MTNNDLRPPSEWEAHEGILISNRAVYRTSGRDEFTPISYADFKQIAEPLTVSHIQKSDTVVEES
jgi:hypothetical protein